MPKNNLENKMRILQSLTLPEQFEKTPTKKIINLVNSVINQIEFFLPYLQTLLENLLKRKLSASDKTQVLLTLLQVNLKNNHLSNSLDIYEILNKKNKLSDLQKFKIDDLLTQKFLQLFQYDKAHVYCKKLLDNPVFPIQLSTVQIHHILDFAIILQNLKNYNFTYTCENAETEKVCTWLRQSYFKILKNENSPKIEPLLKNYLAFMSNPNSPIEIKDNILLNLPIIKILIEQKQQQGAYRLLKYYLNLKQIKNYEKIQVVLLLMPLAKEKNINEFLELTEQFNACFQNVYQRYKNVAGNYTQLAYDNFALNTSLQEKELNLKTDLLTHCLSRNSMQDLTFNFKTGFGGVVFFDLNDLKNINDSMGHIAGDKYLEDFSALLLPFVSDTVRVIRYGGDEFLLIAHEHTKEQIVKIVERILRRAKKAVKILNKKIYIRFAVGISLYPENANNINKLIQLADKAMYQSKQEKQLGNNYHFAH